MKISKQARRDAKALFLSCRANGVLDEAKVRDVVQRIVAAKPRGYLGVLSHFQRLVKLYIDQRTARVESASPVSPVEQSELSDSLTRRYGPGLNISFIHNPAMIGGLRIKVGSDVIDGTVQGRLQALAESF
ncbi:MAG: F0F1 ATP synthase subunit delta [Verrucomicrobia subdivision 3 bacterium]|nr:F0F1 ATP synthase subunit delta [Limisphaerales bacterium]